MMTEDPHVPDVRILRPEVRAAAGGAGRPGLTLGQPRGSPVARGNQALAHPAGAWMSAACCQRSCAASSSALTACTQKAGAPRR